MSRGLAVLLLLSASGCATARLVRPPPQGPADPREPRIVVLEPLFEAADWQTSTRTEYATVVGSPSGLVTPGYSSGYGPSSGPTNVAITRQVSEKPLFARVPTLNEVHRRLFSALQRLRPSWRVTSTGGSGVVEGRVHLVRTVIQGNELTASDRTLKNLAFAFGLVLLPLQILALQPVEETVRVDGMLERFDLDATAIAPRLVRYPTQPDYAVNLAGYSPLHREFALDVTYEEGLLADETPRANVLVEGFVERLATAVVALVEEPFAPAAPAPPPTGAAPAPAPAPPRTP